MFSTQFVTTSQPSDLADTELELETELGTETELVTEIFNFQLPTFNS